MILRTEKKKKEYKNHGVRVCELTDNYILVITQLHEFNNKNYKGVVITQLNKFNN